MMNPVRIQQGCIVPLPLVIHQLAVLVEDHSLSPVEFPEKLDPPQL